MRYTDVKAELRQLGPSLHLADGEYRVNFYRGAEATAYYTDDLADALRTGRARGTGPNRERG